MTDNKCPYPLVKCRYLILWGWSAAAPRRAFFCQLHILNSSRRTRPLYCHPQRPKICVAIRSRNHLSWADDHGASREIFQCLFKGTQWCFTSRSLVGSSRSSTLASSFSIRARCTRFLSPPDSIETFFC